MATRSSSFPFLFNEFTPEFFQRTEIKSRTVAAIMKFLANLSPMPAWNGISTPSEENVNKAIDVFEEDIQKVYGKFKIGEDYSEMNIFEKWGDGITRNLLNYSSWYSWSKENEWMDVKTAIQDFWDNFLNLKKEKNDKDLKAILSEFSKGIHTSFDYSVKHKS